MRYTDIAIIGAGLAGSTAAAMLGRAGIATILVDPHPIYPPDFRVEKLSGSEQIERFRKTGDAKGVLRKATLAEENWIARFGYLLDKAPRQQFGIMYDTRVNTIRAEIPREVQTIFAKAVSISTSRDRQKVVLSNDETISRPGSPSSPTASMSACARCSASNAVSSAPRIRFRSGLISPPMAAAPSTFRR